MSAERIIIIVYIVQVSQISQTGKDELKRWIQTDWKRFKISERRRKRTEQNLLLYNINRHTLHTVHMGTDGLNRYIQTD